MTDASTETLERMARAIAKTNGGNEHTDWPIYLDHARAALAAAPELIVAPISVNGGPGFPDAVVGLIETIDRTFSEETSPEIATIAARLMNHPEEDVRRVAASALTQVSNGTAPLDADASA